MSITVPAAGQEISAETFGIPVANEVNRLTGVVLPNELAFTQITAPVNITASTVTAAQTIVTAAAVTFDGSPVIIEFFCPAINTPAASGGQFGVNLWDGSTDLGYLGTVNSIGAVVYSAPCLARRRITPTPGSHTYSIRGWIYPNGSQGQITAGLGTKDLYAPAYIRISRA